MQVSPRTQLQQSPSVRVQQPSPTPATPATPNPMLAQSTWVGGWTDGYSHPPGLLSAIPRTFQDQRLHKRGSSGSSVTSVGPPSPLAQNTTHPHIVATSDSSFASSYDFDFNQTPHTAKSESMIYPVNFGGAVDMRRIQSTGADERASYSLSAPQSVSTLSHNSPATPHTTTFDPEYDDKNLYGYPSAAYQQSLRDVFPDQATAAFTMPMHAVQQQNVQRMAANPHRQTMMADRLQAAQNDHLTTGSPTSNPRGKSPFRQNSPYSMPAPVARPQPPTLQKQRTSVSPKELMLADSDVDDTAAPLFAPEQSPSLFAAQRRPASNLASFYTPNMVAQMPPQYSFVPQASAQGQASVHDMTPDFPAHLLSMESTGDEGPSEPSSQQSLHRHRSHVSTAPQQAPPQRPVDTSSDSGTYSCTYHGCHLRFDSPAKLQKHKREGHRQSSPSSASPNLAMRNSQAGPHRCDRINPSTGKPCGSIFSRPYDLTRHEDTIHNARKLKVRCHLCTEEKTFSRNDALTRHMRVVHPDVDWVGKQKRKSLK